MKANGAYAMTLMVGRVPEGNRVAQFAPMITILGAVVIDVAIGQPCVRSPIYKSQLRD
jgi:hypothetical protein